MNRRSFYAEVRSSLFAGRLGQGQVDGMDALLDEFEQRAGFDRRWFAYILATTFHETARTMQPIEEFGRGRGRPYGEADADTGKSYFGRGFVQLTHKTNYDKLGRKLGKDLVANPELALQPEIATAIIFEGMVAGDFTGKKLGSYFTASTSDWYEARRIVNILDRAALIADYGRKFYAAVIAATNPSLAALTPDPMPNPDGTAAAFAAPRGMTPDATLDDEEAAIIAEYLSARRE